MTSQIFHGGLVMDAVQVCEAAAIAAFGLTGHGNEKAADEAAANAMRAALNDLAIDGVVVIGEGRPEKTSVLYVGERLGRGGGPRIDVGLEPLEGASLTAKSMANAMAVMAWAPAGTLMNAPDIYMEKIACGPGLPAGLLDLRRSPGENALALAAAKGVAATDITICVLDRPRHAELIASLRAVGARVSLIADGDVAGVIHTMDRATGIDMYMGQGGAPEGVLACAALKCAGGQFQGRFVFRHPEDRARALSHGVSDPERLYGLDDLVTSEAIFVATGVTDGVLLQGVRMADGAIRTHTLVMNSAAGTLRHVRMQRRL